MGVPDGLEVEVNVLDRCKPYPAAPAQFKVPMLLTDTVQKLRETIADVCKYPVDSFEFHVAPKDEETHANLFAHIQKTMTLLDLQVNTLTGRLTIMAKEGMSHLFPVDDVLARAMGGGHETGQEMVPIYGPSLPQQVPHLYEDDMYADAMPYSNYRAANRFSWDEKSSTGYVALESKVSPSFLTGALQMLFHNLAFRRFVFAWPYADWMESRLKDPSSLSVIERLTELDDRSIMTQMQRLFARLQLLNERMTKTGPLLKALGVGETREVFGKLEVEEFLAHLFNRMEEECVGTPLQGRLDALVRHTERKVARCSECNLEMSTVKQKAVWKIHTLMATETQQEIFVADFGDGVARYLAQYDLELNCHKCQRATVCTVQKEIISVPQLMFVSLNRFVFFPSLARRSKVRRRIPFPSVLKMADYVDVADAELRRNDSSVSLGLPDEELHLTGMLIHSGPSDHGIHSAVIKPPIRERWFAFADADIEEVHNMQNQLQVAYGKRAVADEDECAYLLAYQKPVTSERAVSYMDVPDYLQALVREEHASRVERKRRKSMDREMQRIEVMFGNEIREVRVHGSATMAAVTEQAATVFGLDKTLSPGTYRLRKWDKHYQVPAETFGSRPHATVSSCRFYATDMLMIETLGPHQAAFVEYDTGCMSVKVQLYLPESNSFTPHHIVTLQKRNDPLLALKKLLAIEFGVPAAEQRIFRESSAGSAEAGTVELIGDGEELSYKLHVWEGVNLFLEHSDAPPSDPSPCQNEVDRAKNRAMLSYWFEGREVTLPVDRRDRFYGFRFAIATNEHLEMDQFKVYQVFAPDVRAELKNEDQPLHELIPAAHAREPAPRLVAERVAARAAERVRLQVVVAAGGDRGGVEPLPGGPEEWPVADRVADLAALLAQRLDPGRVSGRFLRLREVDCGGELGNILPLSLPLKDAANVLYANKIVALELLPHADPKTDKSVVVFVVMHARGDWTLSPPQEMVLPRSSGSDALYAAVAAKLGLDVAVVGLAKATGSVSPLDVPQLDWNPKVPSFIRVSGVPQNTLDTSPFFLRDGDLLIARDNTEAMQDLTDEKKFALMNRK